MTYEIKGGAFPVVVCQMEKGEQMITESGSMVWQTPDFKMETTGGGLGKMFAKAFAGGYPFGAVVGKREIMSCGVPASGTFNGNPVGVAAALATLEELSQPGVYQRFDRLGQLLEEGFRALGEKYHRKLYLRHMGSIFVLYFGYTEDVADFRDWLGHADVAAYERFVAGCEDYGVRFTDLRGREYLSTAHTEEDICRTLAVADQVLGEMAQEGV